MLKSNLYILYLRTLRLIDTFHQCGFVDAGRFRVLYKDKKWTYRMGYDEANELAKCFGGEVAWVGKFDPYKHALLEEE